MKFRITPLSGLPSTAQDTAGAVCAPCHVANLVPLLNQKDFSIAWQARKSLQAMTGQDKAYDGGAWLQYITGPNKPLG